MKWVLQEWHNITDNNGQEVPGNAGLLGLTSAQWIFIIGIGVCFVIALLALKYVLSPSFGARIKAEREYDLKHPRPRDRDYRDRDYPREIHVYHHEVEQQPGMLDYDPDEPIYPGVNYLVDDHLNPYAPKSRRR